MSQPDRRLRRAAALPPKSPSPPNPQAIPPRVGPAPPVTPPEPNVPRAASVPLGGGYASVRAVPAQPPHAGGPVPAIVAEGAPRGGKPSGSGYAGYRRRKSPPWALLAISGVILLGAAALVWVNLQEPALTVGVPDKQTAAEAQIWRYKVPVTSSGHRELRFELVKSPPGVELNAQTGELRWLPGEEHGGQTYDVVVRAAAGAQQVDSAFAIEVREVHQSPRFASPGVVEVSYNQNLDLVLQAVDPDIPTSTLVFELGDGAPEGLSIEGSTGRLTWSPAAEARGKTYSVVTKVLKSHDPSLAATLRLQIQLEKPPLHPVESLVQQLRAAKLKVMAATPEPGTARLAGERWKLDVDSNPVWVYCYADEEQRLADQRVAAAEAKNWFGEQPFATRLYGYDRFVVQYPVQSPELITPLETQLGSPFSVVAARTPEPFPMPLATAPVETAPLDPYAEWDARLHDIYRRNRLLNLAEYPAIRKVFSQRFEHQYQAAIRQGLGDDYAEMYAWFDEHPEVKEELFIAFCPEDNVAAGLALFNELRKQFPKLLPDYSSLGIALAVTWDVPRSVYDYGFHARRTQAIMPDELAAAVHNFEYYTSTEKYMGGRIQYVPWEFLVHVVNHKTPAEERAWAIREYLLKRPMIGKCYHDVPYDQVMLETNSQVCKLNGKPYTLDAIRNFGGVCAMQADFAARVGQSLGVPAIYVGGTGANGSQHAWVMWVEIRNATKTSIQFTLESWGRYQIDHYYVGEFRDPQTGQPTTDRMTELRLQTVGLNYVAKRQADLVMRFVPKLCELESLDPKKQLVVLRDVVNLCPGNEASWRAMASLVREGKLNKSDSRTLNAVVERMFTTFKNVPDFTLDVFEDMVCYVDEGKPRNAMYERLIDLYDAAKRPDLSCAARLKLTELLLAQQQSTAAVEGLAATIKRFPGEGNYVPRMLDKMEQICRDIDGAEPQMLKFYTEYLPLVPKKRGNEVSDYCVTIYTRAIKRFQEAGREDLARKTAAELELIRAGRI